MKVLVPALLSLVALGGCASVQRGSIPVVDSTGSAHELEQESSGGGYAAPQPYPAAESASDEGAVVMIPQGGSASPIQVLPADGASAPSWQSQPPAIQNSPPPLSGIPSGGLAADEQLDGPVLALLTTARQQQHGGDLNGASSSLERAQRIAPREPQVLYRLAELRLAQGDATQAEQFARRGLSHAAGRPALQAGLWELIAQSRERLGDAAGAAQARQNARVNL